MSRLNTSSSLALQLRSSGVFSVACLFAALAFCHPPLDVTLLAQEVASQQNEASQAAVPDKVTVIRESTTLDPAQDYGRLVIAASNITVDGQGIVLEGDAGLPPNRRSRTAIFGEGVSNVTIRNISARYWETGLHIRDGEGWRVEKCDFSDNFHDPDYGWGENGRRGGILLERVRRSTLINNRANRVWDACVLLNSSENKLLDNDFSHASNTCLKLWTASNNSVTNNQLTHGIRITPGEVHARDSTSVLIESGSNGNRFVGNNCTYGGDGIFIRVLNGWCSTDNYFEGNDCSYANNNGIECWSPRNEFVKNRANHCSYGFWLGGSDQTRLIDNEASFNGLASGNHNSPHLPDNGHAGIVFMFGPSSHIVARGNRCIGNQGAGLALIGDLDSAGKKWRAYHWIIQNNTLNSNRWGIYAQFADWIRLVDNHFDDNTLQDVLSDVGVTNVSTVDMDEQPSGGAEGADIPRVEITGPRTAVVGQPLTFACVVRGSSQATELAADSPRKQTTPGQASPSAFEWQLGDATLGATAEVRHTYREPGFYRVGVNASFDQGLELAYRDLVVVADVPELASDAGGWSFEAEDGLGCQFERDASFFVAGTDSVRCDINPYHGGLARLEYPRSRDAGWKYREDQHLGFWMKAINPNMPGWQSNNPEIALHGNNGKRLRLMPKSDLFSGAQASEAREGWRYIRVPLGVDEAWERSGDELQEIQYITIGIDSWDAQPITIWIDGLIVEP